MTSSKLMLEKLAQICNQKHIPDYILMIEISITSSDETWFFSVNPVDGVKLIESINIAPQITFRLTKETLKAIYTGKMTGLTAIGRETMQDKTPLDFELNPNVKLTPDLMNQLLDFIQHCFNPTYPEMIPLDKKYARIVHGVWAIPLFYHSGFRSAWYQVERDQTLNKPGDTNPFPQAFIIVSGKGYAQIDKITVEVQAGEAYYIPPNAEHLVWNELENPLTLIYLAWGNKA